MKKKRITAAILSLILLLTVQTAFAIEPAPTDFSDEEATESDIPSTETELPGEPTDEPADETEPIIPVTDIEIGDYEKEIEIDATMTISANVLPLNATDQSIAYRSSNPAVATVSSNGTVKGISAGKATITLVAGDITETITVRVIIKEKTISLNQTYIVLKPNATFSLKATVLPQNATYRAVRYKSLDEKIATVTTDGIITAKSCGTGTITISSENVTVAVTVIVNQNTNDITLVEKQNIESESGNANYPLCVQASEYPYIEPDMLRYCYENSRQLIIQGNGYQLFVDGKKIKNYNNPLKTDIDLHMTQQGIAFNLNEGESLCGEVALLLDDAPKRLYLYNESKERYQEVSVGENHVWKITTAGNYLSTDVNLNSHAVVWWIILSASCIALVLITTYVVVKKKYWFW